MLLTINGIIWLGLGLAGLITIAYADITARRFYSEIERRLHND
jgi:hypothetical protein